MHNCIILVLPNRIIGEQNELFFFGGMFAK
jgi:hypothetical protein